MTITGLDLINVGAASGYIFQAIRQFNATFDAKKLSWIQNIVPALFGYAGVFVLFLGNEWKTMDAVSVFASIVGVIASVSLGLAALSWWLAEHLREDRAQSSKLRRMLTFGGYLLFAISLLVQVIV